MLAYNRGVERPEEPPSLPHHDLSRRPEPRALGENDVRAGFLRSAHANSIIGKGEKVMSYIGHEGRAQDLAEGPR
jgi:hypothetical protein